MPETTEMAACDACAIERADVADEPNADGMRYCADCAERRADDPPVFIAGRTMTVSEIERQAVDDEHLANVLEGDTVQEAIKDAKTAASQA